MVGNLNFQTSVLQNLCDTKGVSCVRKKAVDKDGNPVWKEKWTKEEQTIPQFVGYSCLAEEMMHIY